MEWGFLARTVCVCYSLFTLSWQWFKTEVYIIVECTYLTYMRHGKAVPIVCCVSASLPQESVFNLLQLSALAMPGRGKRAKRTANASIYHVYMYFEKCSA